MVRGLIDTQGQGDVWVWSASGTHIWLPGLTQLWFLLLFLHPNTNKS